MAWWLLGGPQDDFTHFHCLFQHFGEARRGCFFLRLILCPWNFSIFHKGRPNRRRLGEEEFGVSGRLTSTNGHRSTSGGEGAKPESFPPSHRHSTTHTQLRSRRHALPFPPRVLQPSHKRASTYHQQHTSLLLTWLPHCPAQKSSVASGVISGERQGQATGQAHSRHTTPQGQKRKKEGRNRVRAVYVSMPNTAPDVHSPSLTCLNVNNLSPHDSCGLCLRVTWSEEASNGVWLKLATAEKRKK